MPHEPIRVTQQSAKFGGHPRRFSCRISIGQGPVFPTASLSPSMGSLETPSSCSSLACTSGSPCSRESLRHRLQFSTNTVHRDRGEGCKPDRNRDRRLRFRPRRTRREEGARRRCRRNGNCRSRRQRSELAVGRIAFSVTFNRMLTRGTHARKSAAEPSHKSSVQEPA